MDIECNTCSEVKEQTEFYKNKHRSTGHNSICKPCQKAYQAARPPVVATDYSQECSSCLVTKEGSYFYKNKHTPTGRDTRCRKCISATRGPYHNDPKHKASNKARRAKHRKFLDRYKVLCGCAECGFKADAAALDFAHIDPATKDDKLGGNGIASGWGMPRIKAEIKKCRVLCSNCHRTETHNDKDKFTLKPTSFTKDAISNRARKTKNRALVSRYKTICGCSMCDHKGIAATYDLDHIAKDTKDHTKAGNSAIGYEWGRDRIKAEIRKCRVLCSNCHRIETKRNDHYQKPRNPE